MSITGPGLLDSELAREVDDQILDLWDAGVPAGDIRTRLASRAALAATALDAEIVLATRVRALWEIGALPTALRLELLERVDAGLGHWGEDAQRREAALRRLLKQTETPKVTPRPPRPTAAVRRKLFAVGDCVQLVVDEGTFRGIVCKLRERRGRCEYGILLMATRTGAKRQSFESGRYYGHYIGTPTGDMPGPHLVWPEHRILLRAGNPFTLLAHVEIDPTRFLAGSYGVYADMRSVVRDFETARSFATDHWYRLLPVADLLRGG